MRAFDFDAVVLGCYATFIAIRLSGELSQASGNWRLTNDEMIRMPIGGVIGGLMFRDSLAATPAGFWRRSYHIERRCLLTRYVPGVARC